MIIVEIPDRFKYVIVSVNLKKLIPPGIPKCNCNQRVSPKTVTFLENQFGWGLENVIAIVLFGKLIPQNKIVACNHFDDEGKPIRILGLVHWPQLASDRRRQGSDRKEKSTDKTRGPAHSEPVHTAGTFKLGVNKHGVTRGQKINANFFCTKFFNNPSGHGRPRRKSWTSAPKSVFSCGPGGGEKLFDPWAFGRKGQECPQEIRAKKFLFMLFFLP